MGEISTSTLDLIRERVRVDFAAAEGAHDFEHARRVAELARHIAAEEGGESAIAYAAGLVHDYHRLLPNHGVGQPAEAAIHLIEQALRDCGIEHPATLARITDCVAFTDKYLCAGDTIVAPSLEAAAVRDADNLDAIGAIGIARALTFGAHLNEPIWVEGVPLRDTYEHGHAPSVIHHFHEKLLHLADEMTTLTGKKIAGERHEYVEEFSRRLRAEWSPAFR